MKRYIVPLLFLILVMFSSMGWAQTTELEDDQITIYVSPFDLVLYVINHDNIDLNHLVFEAGLGENKVEHWLIDSQIPEHPFAGVESLEGPFCLRIIMEDQAISLPSECKRINERVLLQTIVTSERFWIVNPGDPNSGEQKLFSIYIDEDFSDPENNREQLSFCGNSSTVCRVNPSPQISTPEATEPGPSPTPSDLDGDGLIDSIDGCPNVAGPVTNNGCPLRDSTDNQIDSDGDGFINSEDLCVDESGPVGGCPDSDGDGIADRFDNCPDVPGLGNRNGCPESISSTPRRNPTPAPVSTATPVSVTQCSETITLNGCVFHTDGQTYASFSYQSNGQCTFPRTYEARCNGNFSHNGSITGNGGIDWQANADVCVWTVCVGEQCSTANICPLLTVAPTNPEGGGPEPTQTYGGPPPTDQLIVNPTVGCDSNGQGINFWVHNPTNSSVGWTIYKDGMADGSGQAAANQSTHIRYMSLENMGPMTWRIEAGGRRSGSIKATDCQ